MALTVSKLGTGGWVTSWRGMDGAACCILENVHSMSGVVRRRVRKASAHVWNVTAFSNYFNITWSTVKALSTLNCVWGMSVDRQKRCWRMSDDASRKTRVKPGDIYIISTSMVSISACLTAPLWTRCVWFCTANYSCCGLDQYACSQVLQIWTISKWPWYIMTEVVTMHIYLSIMVRESLYMTASVIRIEIKVGCYIKDTSFFDLGFSFFSTLLLEDKMSIDDNKTHFAFSSTERPGLKSGSLALALLWFESLLLALRTVGNCKQKKLLADSCRKHAPLDNFHQVLHAGLWTDALEQVQRRFR